MGEARITHCHLCEESLSKADPGEGDWFRDGDRAILCCYGVKEGEKARIVARHLETPAEYRRVKAPDWCPINKEVKGNPMVRRTSNSRQGLPVPIDPVWRRMKHD